VPFGGDLSKLGALEANLHRLARVPARVAVIGAERLADVIDRQFDDGLDPNGSPWAPLAARTLAKGRRPPPLTDTGAMRASVRVMPMPGAGISVTIDHPGLVHQTGGSSGRWYMPPRPVLPGRIFPTTWRRALDDAKADAFAGR